MPGLWNNASVIFKRLTLAETAARSKWLWITAIPLVLGLVFLSAAAFLQWSTMTFRKRAQTIEGRSVRMWRSTSYSTSFRHGATTSYMVAYEFDLPLDGTVRGSDDIGYWDWQLKPGGRVTIYYLPSAPARNGLSRPWLSGIGLIFAVLGSMLLFVGCVGEYCVVSDLRKADIAKHRPPEGRSRGRRLH
jgi:hypothetical protein